MKKLLVYLKAYKKESILGPLFKMLEASFELFVPLVIASIIDTGITTQDKGYILSRCGILILLGIIGLVCSVTAQYFAAKASVGFAKKIRHVLFSHIQTLSFTELDTLGISTLITRLTSDIHQVQNGVNLTLRLFLRSPFVVFGAMLMAFTIDVKCALIFAVAIPVLSVVVFGIMLISIPLYKKAQRKLDQVLLTTRENLTGVRVIRAFCKEADEIDSFHNANVELTQLQKYVGRISALLNPLTYIIINLAVIALIRQGSLQVSLGILTQGQIVALYNYMSQILVELIKLANLIISITKAVACGNRIQSVLEVTTSMRDGSSQPEPISGSPAVEFQQVELRYAGAAQASLSDISFSANTGETIGIIGGTGSGKTSLVNLLPRFYDATAGKITINGTDIQSYELQSLRGKIGIVPQKAVLFKGSIRENLQWGKEDASDEEIWDAIYAAQAGEVIAGKEGGLSYELEQGGKNLSGGQRQRLTIARALVQKPEILILDDSSSALDFATEAALRKALYNLSWKPTVFIVSQRTSSIRHADKIIVLEDGTTVGIGTHDELLSSCEVYREIYESQFKKEVSGSEV
ncbi:MAG: ABC transporter ATP-binding protein [Acetivibrio ethanolgignens]